ncbi:hypothetical protein QM012_005628 [Aureobasidium pullulans]|uniref:Uncharacterized protein n=1 Tax=Aureobasidium pullulans TaxID=5580 RepID=A0ABR0TRX0_AURPU
MSGHVAVDSRIPSSPFGPAHAEHASLYAPDSITIWHSSPSPSKPVTATQNLYDFDIEELSDSDVGYAHGAQVLHPYELEEVDTPVADCSSVNSPYDIREDADEEDAHDSDSAAFSRRLRRMRWKPASQPYAFTRLSPVQTNPRKRLRSEAVETDTDSDGFDSSYARSKPPRLRRRIQKSDNTPNIVTTSNMSVASTTQATTTGDLMDVDEQAA